MADQNQNGGKHVTIAVPMEEVGKQKAKFTKMVSISRMYERRHHEGDLIYQDELMRAVSKNDLEGCRIFLEKNDLRHSKKEYFFHPLLLAAKKGHHDIMKLLLEKGVDVNVQDKKKSTALHYAIQQRCVACCRILIDEGLDITIEDKGGNIPLHIAASEGMVEIVEELLERNKFPNARNKKDQTPMHLACIKGNDRILSILLDAGGRWDFKDVNYWLPLHCAANHGHYNCCDILVERSGEAVKQHLNARNKDKATPLIVAAKKGHSRCCQSLSQSDINAFDSKGNTALHLATSIGFLRTIEVLLEMNPDIETPNRLGNTPLHLAAMQKNLDCLKILVHKYPDINPDLNKDEKSILHLAAVNNCYESLQFLLTIPIFKEQINTKDKEGKTALHLALNQYHSESSECLINGGADCTIRDDKRSIPLHVAAGAGLYTICKSLVAGDRVKQINSKNASGATPLHLAAMNGSIDCCKLLLTKGADLSAIDSDGFSPFHVASNKGNLGVIKLFTKKGGGFINQVVEVSGDTPLHLVARKGYYDCCAFILKNMKKDIIAKLNTQENSALDEAFQANQDKTFYLILSKIPLPSNEDKHIEQTYALQSSLHEYMHEAIESKRNIIQDAIVDSAWWYSGFSSSFCEEGQCPNLVRVTDTNVDLAVKVYDKCIIPDSDSIRYNFRIFEDYYYSPPAGKQDDGYKKRDSPFDESGKLKKDAKIFLKHNQHPLLAAARFEHLSLMQHELTSTYLDYKWNSYMKFILLILVLCEVILVVVMGTYLSYVSGYVGNYDMPESINSSSEICNGHKIPDATLDEINDTWVKIVLLFTVLIVITIGMIFSEIHFHFKIKNSCLYLMYAARVYRLLGTVLLLVPLHLCAYDIAIKETWQWQLGILTLLLSWFHMIHTLNEIPFLSVFMPMTYQFGQSFFRVLLYILLIVFVFAFIFHLLLRGNSAFETIPVSFVKTIVWMLGDLGYDDIFLDEKSPISYPVLTNIIFLLLVTCISGFIINLVITQPSEYADKFRERAVYHKLSSRIELFRRLDAIFDCIGNRFLVSFYVVKIKPTMKPKRESKIVKSPDQADTSVKEQTDTECPSLKLVLERLDKLENLIAESNKK